ncbi:MAG: SLC13 family permease, partial [Bacillota bacterium]
MGKKSGESEVKSFAKATARYVLSALSGPAAFFVVRLAPLSGLDAKAQLCVAVYAWVVLWWCLQPVPWAVSAFVPALLFPVLGVMTLPEAAVMYGQNIIFAVLGIMLLGHAVKKHGLGERIALFFLSSRLVGGSVQRFALVFMVATASLTAVISVASVAIMLPIGAATVSYIASEYAKRGVKVNTAKLGNLVVLGCLNAAFAGVMVSISSSPFNMAAISLLEETTGYTVGFFQWIETGAVMAATGVAATFAFLRAMYRPGVDLIPGGVRYFRDQRKRLGNMKPAEWATL